MTFSGRWQIIVAGCGYAGLLTYLVVLDESAHGTLVTVPTIAGMLLVLVLPPVWIGRARLDRSRRLQFTYQAVGFGSIMWALSVTEKDRPLWHGAVIAAVSGGVFAVFMTWAAARAERKRLRKAAALSEDSAGSA